jgi:hypothetical protein
MAFGKARKAAQTLAKREIRTDSANVTTRITNKPTQISRISTSS